MTDDTHRSFDLVPMPNGLRFASGEDPIHEALLVDRSAFRSDPIPPLSDLYAAAGLVERNGLIAAEGFDWDALHAVADPQPARHLARPRSVPQADLLTEFLSRHRRLAEPRAVYRPA